MKLKLINFIAFFLLMLVTGVFWGTWFTLTRSLDTFSGPEFIHIGKTIIANVAVPMRVIFPTCMLFMLIALFIYPVKRSIGFFWGVTAMLLITATLIITLTILVPFDNQIKEWTPATIPSDWESIRTQWAYFHMIRTFTSLAAFASYVISVINLPLEGRDLN
jgi:uncharacterized membrane protein